MILENLMRAKDAIREERFLGRSFKKATIRVIDLGNLAHKYVELEPHDLRVPRGLVYRAVHIGLSRPVLIRVLQRLSLDGTREQEMVFRRGARAAADAENDRLVKFD